MQEIETQTQESDAETEAGDISTSQDLYDLINKINEKEKTSTARGTAFEKLIRNYLKADPSFSNQIEEAWLWKDFPGKNSSDAGIDIVAKTKDVEYWAIQCKFYKEESSLSKKDIDTFLSKSSEHFEVDGKKCVYSERYIFSTITELSKHAKETIENQVKEVKFFGLNELLASNIDWKSYSDQTPIKFKPKKEVRPHQREAIGNVIDGLKNADQGKLIMACGTGKTFTSLKIAEEQVGGFDKRGLVLFLVPSISLLSQAHREWINETSGSLTTIAVCSDKTSTKETDLEDISIFEISPKVTTKADELIAHYNKWKEDSDERSTYVVFSTYQSLEVIEKAQKNNQFGIFDIIICDEAHRTAGISNKTKSDKESSFLLVHDRDKIKATKRLYMTATPRVYSDSTKQKVSETEEIVLYSMDDEDIFGKELHKIGFGDAVRRDLLTDYKVVVIGLDKEYFASKILQGQGGEGHSSEVEENSEIKLDDEIKLFGCWEVLNKKTNRKNDFADDPSHMKTGLIFANTISSSKKIRDKFNKVVEMAKNNTLDEPDLSMFNLPNLEVRHVDGTMRAATRSEHLDWLKVSDEGDIHLLSNARCLSEGVDVPALDAIIFMQPRKSQVDVVQAVGRVMRKAPGKQFGYIILPIIVTSDKDADEVIIDNKEFSTVVQVLNALKAHDERFEAKLNLKSSATFNDPNSNLLMTSAGSHSEDREDGERAQKILRDKLDNEQLSLPFGSIERRLSALVAEKLSTAKYWPAWAKDVADIAASIRHRIDNARDANTDFADAFNRLVDSLKANINNDINEDDVVEMLSQHVVTKPIFEALFGKDKFALANPVSVALEGVVGLLNYQGEVDSLSKFYNSVALKASAADTKEARQELVKNLYENFFDKAMKKSVERMGIVYTPIEIVDFILKSVDHVLSEQFDRSLADDGVHILDPFTGTGTFMVRLIELGLLRDNLVEKYRSYLHANEIVLLAYYIAAVNIESAFHFANNSVEYTPFEGIVLTDTFNINEESSYKLGGEVFKDNSKRISKQRDTPITVIVGNPPYSAGQKSGNDNAQNLKYPQLDKRIRETYAKNTESRNINSLYDSYIRALRWASDRIGDEGVVSFVTNGGWLKGNSGEGLRVCFAEEFDAVYVVDLRGDIRSQMRSNEKTEGGNVFNVQVPVTIVTLVKNKTNQNAPKGILYFDIGDYLKREEKLDKLKELESFSSITWTKIVPNEHNDWIGQRDNSYYGLVPLAGAEGSVFETYSLGVKTNRDPWVYNSSNNRLEANVKKTIATFTAEVERLKPAKPAKIDSGMLNLDKTKISWTDSLITQLERQVKDRRKDPIAFHQDNIRVGLYRPFMKQYLYFDNDLNERRYGTPNLYPLASTRNPSIVFTGKGANVFAVIATDIVPNLDTIEKGNILSRYRYELQANSAKSNDMFDADDNQSDEPGYRRIDNITDEALAKFQNQYGDASLTKDDLFAYIYGVLNHRGYQEKYKNNFAKDFPRIPWLDKYKEIIEIGKQLLDLHINYEQVDGANLNEEFTTLGSTKDEKSKYRATKMVRPRAGNGKTKADSDRTKIVVNDYLTLTDIPLEASKWYLGGRPALEIFIDRMKPKVDKESGITNDPNDFNDDPNYVVELTKKVVAVCTETQELLCRLSDLPDSGSRS